MPENARPVANPLIVLREEFDDWAILFDPDSGKALGINPVGVLIWKLLDGKHTTDDIIKKVKESCEDVPEEAETHVKKFIEEMVEKGLAGFKIEDR